jgi:hypothetical protein
MTLESSLTNNLEYTMVAVNGPEHTHWSDLGWALRSSHLLDNDSTIELKGGQIGPQGQIIVGWSDVGR